MFVCASTDCFLDLPKDEVLPTLVDLEFTAVELPIRDDARAWCSPSLPVESLERAVEDQRPQRLGDRVRREDLHYCTGGILACFTTRSHFCTSAAT